MNGNKDDNGQFIYQDFLNNGFNLDAKEPFLGENATDVNNLNSNLLTGNFNFQFGEDSNLFLKPQNPSEQFLS